MTILDTNVLSELMKPEPAPVVRAWMAAQSSQSLFTTSITQSEILFGLMLLPSGKRRSAFEAAAHVMFWVKFKGRILSFGSEAALNYATIASDRRQSGQPISQFDAQIAAVARSTGAALATRNVNDFEGCGINVVNPWKPCYSSLFSCTPFPDCSSTPPANPRRDCPSVGRCFSHWYTQYMVSCAQTNKTTAPGAIWQTCCCRSRDRNRPSV
jgi:predicted nucleic acid-binding protein